MENKIFLGKYRVVAAEIELEGESRDAPLAYEGEEIDSGRKVIVELIPAASLKPAVRERLEAEVTAAKKLNHINIPALYDFGVEDDHLVYVTEDFDGTLAEEWVNTHGPMPVSAVLCIASQVVSALGAAAVQRISHHAINPTNIVLVPGQTPEGEWPLVKMLHFVGVASKFYGADEAVAAFDKSSHYASPEQLQRGSVDFRSEIYSLGCTMWFLLTDAPPLAAANSPLAVPPAKLAEKLSGVPKAVRRLLAQMLAANPKDRPNNPLAFYREIQDCRAQVERRETMARRFGVATISTTPVVGTGERRRRPMRALAFAVLLLASAALTAAVLSGYLKHRRVVRSEEPIGVAIGVPDAAASAPPVNTTAANVIVADPTQSNATIADANEKEPATVSSSKEKIAPLPTANDSAEIASTNQVAPAPAEPTAPPNTKPEPSAPVVTTNSTPAAVDTDSAALAAVNKVEPAPTQPESPRAEPKVTVEKSATEKTVMHEVRRAEPAEPEVRRAEPAPPEEGPAKVTASKPRAKKNERDARPKRNADQNLYVSTTAPNFEDRLPPLPSGSVRARFVGIMPDGRWMLVLPSHKVILVPPPPPGR
jgi:eukaryotic-like serine/threonine-protein kinase